MPETSERLEFLRFLVLASGGDLVSGTAMGGVFELFGLLYLSILGGHLGL